MSQLPNPNSEKPFDRVLKDNNGQPQYGIRNEHTRDEEIVFIPSGQSNQQYWQPEIVMNPEGCSHEFVITDIGKREVECRYCTFATSFHASKSFREENGKAYIRLKNNEFPIIS